MSEDNKKYVEFMLPFKLEQTEREYERGMITIKAFGQFFDQFKEFNALYNLNNCTQQQYNELLNLLKDNTGRKIKVLCTIKDQKIKKFKIDLSSLVLEYNNMLFNKLELLAYGVNDRVNTANLFVTNQFGSKVASNRLMIGVKDNVLKKILNLSINLLIIILLIPFIVMFPNRPILGIIGLITIIVLKYIFSNNVNSKIIIENSTIKKRKLYRKPIKIGNISDITSFAQTDMKVTILKNDKDLFSFMIRSSDDNYKFYDYLKNNYKESLRINSMVYFIIYFMYFLVFAFVFLYHLPELIKEGHILYLLFFLGLTIFFLLCTIKEYKKSFYIIKNRIIYKKLFVNKEYRVENLTRVEYDKMRYYRWHYRNSRFSRNAYFAIGYIGNEKIFTVKPLTSREVETMTKLIKEYNSYCQFIRKYNFR